ISAMVYAPQLVMSGPIIATGFVGLTFALVGVVLLSNAQKHLFKSVWIHNKNVLKRGLEVQMK
ncbi:MAG: hypothetical protein MRY83_05500, partial [Flavobacteriales bacterium]|nr:hypothetical protein [Flavobacteriales bacterium]